MVSQYPYRHVQVVLRLYSSPSEGAHRPLEACFSRPPLGYFPTLIAPACQRIAVLNGFDVDSCAVGYDGQTVWVAQRAHLALTTQQNPVDMTRRSPTYEMRLAKYALRGFEVTRPYAISLPVSVMAIRMCSQSGFHPPLHVHQPRVPRIHLIL